MNNAFLIGIMGPNFRFYDLGSYIIYYTHAQKTSISTGAQVLVPVVRRARSRAPAGTQRAAAALESQTWCNNTDGLFSINRLWHLKQGILLQVIHPLCLCAPYIISWASKGEFHQTLAPCLEKNWWKYMKQNPHSHILHFKAANFRKFARFYNAATTIFQSVPVVFAFEATTIFKT